MKRVFDLAFAALGSILLAPVMAWIALKIRADGGGPILFRQTRVGRDGTLFEMLKFRTMRTAPGPSITSADDVRITDVGRWLRRWKLDELPQLWNVIRGEMSLVGPRPELPAIVRDYPPDARQILTVRPGITGPAQLVGIDEEKKLAGARDPEAFYRDVLLPQKLAIDLHYARHASFEHDLRCIARTLARFASEALRPRRRPAMQGVYVLIAVASYLLAYELRTDFQVPPRWYREIVVSLPFLVAARFYGFRRYALFDGRWTHAAVSDLLAIVKAVSVSSVLFVTALTLAFGTHAVPRSMVVIDWTLLIGLLAGGRLVSRRFRTWTVRNLHEATERAIVVGDPARVEPLLHDLADGGGLAMRAIGLVTPAAAPAHGRLHGVPVLGSIDDLPKVLASTPADVVLLAPAAGQASVVRRTLAQSVPGAPIFKIVPPLRERIEGRVHLRDVRDIQIDDLLGRDEVRIDVAGLHDVLTGRSVLITGAAGSIGSELSRQVAAHRPRRLVLLDRAGRALRTLARELVDAIPACTDVRDRERLRGLFAEYRPDLVLHAAAYKHVPMMEMNPVEAVKNNVLATRELLATSDEFGVAKFVLVSTDKAVKPVNVMGYTKRIAERLLGEREGGGAARIAVRFGNVVGSEGSLVPIVLRQIREGGPVTITHPDATRYFMSVQEAAGLVLQATLLGRGGEIFVLDMGEPIRILDFALSLIRLAGLRPGSDVDLRIIGLRAGERLHEETLIDAAAARTVHGKIWLRPPGLVPEGIGAEIDRVEELVHRYDEDGVREWIGRVAATDVHTGMVH